MKPEPCNPNDLRRFVFISYAHTDSATVYQILLRLAPLRFWYDRGIRVGEDWYEDVATALENSSHFAVFLSPASASSPNVREEIHFALSNNKIILPVYIAPTELSSGLKMRLGGKQAIKPCADFEDTTNQIRQALDRDLFDDDVKAVSMLERLVKGSYCTHVLPVRGYNVQVDTRIRAIRSPEDIDRIVNLRPEAVNSVINAIFADRVASYLNAIPDSAFRSFSRNLAGMIRNHIHSSENSPITLIKTMLGFDLEVMSVDLLLNDADNNGCQADA